MDSLPLRHAILVNMKFLQLLFLVLPFTASAAIADPLSDLDSILSQQKAENYACNKFRKKWHSVVKGGLSGDSPSHISKAQALDALKLLEKYRFHGSAQAKGWTYLVENEPSLSQLPDQKALLEKMSQLEQPCEVFSRGVHRQLLLKDVAALSLSKKEARGVADEAKDFLRHQGSGTMGGLGMKLSFLVTYLDTIYDGDNKSALKAKAEALQKDFDAGREQVKTELLALSAAGKGSTIEYWGPEFKLWSRLNGSLEDILKELVL